MQDLQNFEDWMNLFALKSDSTVQHYKSGLSAYSKEFENKNIDLLKIEKNKKK